MSKESVRLFTDQHRLAMAITISISVAIIMTLVSMSLYYTSGAHVLDISRPGYEQARQAVQQPFHSDSFPQDGPINPEVIAEFKQIYDRNRQHLNKIDDFSNQKVMNDRSLRLSEESN